MDSTEATIIIIGAGFLALVGFIIWQAAATKPQESMKTTIFTRDADGRIIDIIEKGTYG